MPRISDYCAKPRFRKVINHTREGGTGEGCIFATDFVSDRIGRNSLQEASDRQNTRSFETFRTNVNKTQRTVPSTMGSTPVNMWDKIAKTGTYTDMHGNVYTFTSDSFREIAENYTATEEKAPLVVGHPDTDSPAFGWVGSLRVSGDYLEAQYENVSEQVKEAVNKDEYRYKSISLFPDLKRLKHVGLLGAVPPAMSGLGKVQFGSGDSVILSFAENINTGVNSMGMTLEEALQKQAELQTAITKLQEENAALKSELEKLTTEKKTAEAQTEQTQANFAAFKKDVCLKARSGRVDALIAQGKLEPARKDEVMKIAEKLSEGSPSFSSDSDSLENEYFKSLENRETNPLFAEFSAPVKDGVKENYSSKDIVNKL